MIDNAAFNLDEYNNIPNVEKNFFDQVSTINSIVLRNTSIYYNDDYWDFTFLNDTVKANWSYTFDFQKYQLNYRKYIKEFILIELMRNRRKIPQVKHIFNKILRFTNYLNSEYIYFLENISADNIYNHLSKYNSENKSAPYKVAIHDFLDFYEAYNDFIFSKEIYKSLYIDNAQVKAERQMAKTPDIPPDYFNHLLNFLVELRDKKDLPILDLICVCYLILQTQTGLRSSEILEIPYNCLKSVTSKKYGTIDYLLYISRKGQRTDLDKKECITYINNICLITICKIKNALKPYYNSKVPKYLFIHPSRTQDTPIKCISSLITNFFYMNNDIFPSLDLPDDFYPSVARHPHKIWGTKYVLTYPSNAQFRVHTITELYFAKKIPLNFIQKYMNHLTSEMTAYYIRPGIKQIQENMPFTEKILKDIVTNTVKPLGANATSLVENIKKYIENNNFNIAIDLNEIIEKLSNEIPIRQKAGGVCIKSSLLRDCTMDAITNEYYCAYGVCPNIYHFYYMIDATYKQITQLLSSISVNKARNNLKQAYKENKMLNFIIKTRFEPELNELKSEIKKKGASSIIEQYPETEYIVKHIKEVQGELEEWKQMRI